jgi:hypothetical protein
MTANKPFDLKNLVLPPNMAGQMPAATPTKVRTQTERFVKFPMDWVERLAGIRRGVTYRVALHLLYRHWRGNGRPVQLTTKGLGVCAHSKWNALRDLERLGLIIVERRPNRSPLVVVILRPGKT